MKRTLIALSLVLFALTGFSQTGDLPPQNFTATYQWNEGTFGTRLTWEKDQSVNLSVNRYHIFRGTDPNQLKKIAYQINMPYNYHYEYLDENILPDLYYYMVSAEYNDGTVCNSDTLTVNVTSIIETSDLLNLFPNPTTGQITLQAENMTEVRVVNSIGQTLCINEVQGSVLSIDLSPFGKGLFLVLIQTENGWVRTKVVVE